MTIKTFQPQEKIIIPPQPDFKKIELSDRLLLKSILSRFPQRISGFTFATLFSWNPVYQYEWASCGPETLLISCKPTPETARHFLQPVGNFEPAAQALLLANLEKRDYPTKIFGVSKDFIRQYPAFVAHFDVKNDPALANYIYRAKDLATLAGKFYAKKRNMIAQARKLYDWTVHPLTPENSGECLVALARVDDNDPKEKSAVITAVKNFAALDQKGLLIKIDGKPVAFSIFEALYPETAVTHFEKADRHYKGLYQIVNQESAKMLVTAGFSLINREEDMGIAGLHQAKHSYGPSEIIPAYTLVFNSFSRTYL